MQASMNTHDFRAEPSTAAIAPLGAGLRVGIDIAQISAIEASIADFGERFTHRLFSADELAYAERAPALDERITIRKLVPGEVE